MCRNRHQLTDRDMLRAAEAALAEHRSTRPATAHEAAILAQTHRARAEARRLHAARLLGQRLPTADEARSVEAQHIAALCYTEAVKDAMDAERSAAIHDLRAEAWEALDPAAAWAETDAMLVARVERYRRMVEASAR